MSVAAGRPLLNGAVFTNALVCPSNSRRSCHGSSSDSNWQHWQTSKSTTTVAHALSMEKDTQPPPLRPKARATRLSRSRRLRAGLVQAAARPGDRYAPGPASEHAGAHLPLAMFQARNGSPGASSSEAGTANPAAGAAASRVDSTAEAQVALLRSELQEMRRLVTAQAAVTAQQELTISGLQRSLLKLPPAGSTSLVGGPPPATTREFLQNTYTAPPPMRHIPCFCL